MNIKNPILSGFNPDPSIVVCVNGIERFLVERECVEELVKVIEKSF